MVQRNSRVPCPAERARHAKSGSGWPFMRFAVWLIERPRWFKRAVLIVNDLVLLSLAVWAAYTLRLSRLYVPGIPTSCC